MKYGRAKQSWDNPALLDFYVDGEKIANMHCLPGSRVSAKQIEATARVVIDKSQNQTDKKEDSSEDSTTVKEDLHTEDKQKPGSTKERSDGSNIPAAKRDRKKAAQTDKR